MMAHINTSGVHVPLWMDSESPKIGWGVSPNYPKQEGTFFGNIIMTGNLSALAMPNVTAPVAYFCEGAGITAGVVAGRLTAGATNVPYKNPYGTNVKCTSSHGRPLRARPARASPRPTASSRRARTTTASRTASRSPSGGTRRTRRCSTRSTATAWRRCRRAGRRSTSRAARPTTARACSSTRRRTATHRSSPSSPTGRTGRSREGEHQQVLWSGRQRHRERHRHRDPGLQRQQQPVVEHHRGREQRRLHAQERRREPLPRRPLR